MDTAKCKAFKSRLAKQPGPWMVSIEHYFDGNEDAGSIAWNLSEHPGIDVFREVLTGLLRRPDVQAIYARVSQLDLGDDNCWPATDIIYIVGTISPGELGEILGPLKPVEVCPVEFSVPSNIRAAHSGPVVAVSWGLC